MLLRLVPLFVVTASIAADYTEKCDDAPLAEELDLISSSNDSSGSFVVKWCTKANINDELHLTLMYINVTKAECNESGIGKSNKSEHSEFSDLIDTPLNCSSVCHWKKLNMLFTGCYMVEKSVNNLQKTPKEYRFINSSKYDAFKNGKVTALSHSNGENMSLTWYMRNVPVTEGYEVQVCYLSNNTRSYRRPCEDGEDGSSCVSEWKDVDSGLCAVRGGHVQCETQLPFGRYKWQLMLNEPWNIGSFFNDYRLYHYCDDHAAPLEQGSEGAGVSGGRAAAWAVGCGCAVVALAALATLVLWDRRRAKRYIETLWPQRRRPEAETAAAPGGPVLLLHARDCAPAAALARALARLLEPAAPGQVYELFSPRVRALCADSPREWVRQMIAAPGTRVVLLETPAAAALLAPALRTRSDGSFAVSAPLLWKRAAYREPDPLDDVLLAAVNQLRATAHSYPQYHKFFVVRVDGLQQEEVAEHVSPFVRFSVPSSAPALLQHLAPTVAPACTSVPLEPSPPGTPTVRLTDGPPSPSLTSLELVRVAAADLVRYVRDHPDYLDELAVAHAPLHDTD